jgi:aspartate/methionine/tyrosine aminotransferase
MVEEFDRRRRAVVSGLNQIPGVSCAIPRGAFYAFPNIASTGWRSKPLASALLEEAGVATIGGPDFGVYGEGNIRVSYANSMDRIMAALERIRGFLNERRPAA